MKSFRITLPLPPTTNNLYSTVRGRRVLSAKGRMYKRATAHAVCAASEGWRPGAARLGVLLTLHFPDRRRSDLANREKVLIDAIAMGLAFDDCQVDDLHLVRGAIDKAYPRCEVELWVIVPRVEESLSKSNKIELLGELKEIASQNEIA